MIIKRDYYLKKIIDKRENGRIKIITGIRRCGKSYLLFNLYQEYLLSKGVKENQIISIALDEIDNLEYRNPFRLNESSIPAERKAFVPGGASAHIEDRKSVV